MLLTATGLFIEFARFIKIIFWIIIPVFFIAMVVVALLHRRKKIKAGSTATDQGESILASIDDPGHGAYLLFDHSGLVRKYRNKLFYNQARYIALRHDYQKLEAKLASLSTIQLVASPENNTTMENQAQQTMILSADVASENRELADRLDQLTRAYQSLEEENDALAEQIRLQTATDEEKASVVSRWREENVLLKTKAAEQEYLQDIVDEKKRQIDFLQQQLEQRIRVHHSSEQQLSSIQSELHLKYEQILQREQSVATVEGRLIILANELRDLREQNEMLNAALADSREVTATLEHQVLHEQSRAELAEQRLASNRQMLLRLYREFSSCVGNEGDKNREAGDWSREAGERSREGEWSLEAGVQGPELSSIIVQHS
ncbi:MAG: hypothetical protein H7Y42_04995 [Chitinophagaceae bacterium]|nr:hypothetical protein [Chitinophagaceae bacterium]